MANVYLPDEMKEKLKLIAMWEKKTLSKVMQEALEEYLKKKTEERLKAREKLVKELLRWKKSAGVSGKDFWKTVEKEREKSDRT